MVSKLTKKTITDIHLRKELFPAMEKVVKRDLFIYLFKSLFTAGIDVSQS